jgi:hypothetical protein
MSQIRVLEPQDSKYAKDLKDFGLRFCGRDRRWEKNGKTETLRSLAADITVQLKGVRVQLKEGGKDEEIEEVSDPTKLQDSADFVKGLEGDSSTN